MAQFPKIDEEFKQNVSAKFQEVKEKVTDAVLKEDGSLNTEKIGAAVTGTAKKVGDTVREGYQKFSEEYVKDGSLNKEKLEDAASRTYHKAGRKIATGVSKLADYLTDKFGVEGQTGEIVDSEIVAEPFTEDNDFAEDYAEDIDFVDEEPVTATVSSENIPQTEE